MVGAGLFVAGGGVVTCAAGALTVTFSAGEFGVSRAPQFAE
jgi:hypothetical protein